MNHQLKWISVFLLTLSFQAKAEFLSINKLNEKLKQENAGWVAKDTWLNHLSEEELVRMMGVKDIQPATVDFSTDNLSRAGTEVFDWRDQKGLNFVSPVLNQGGCGSCVSFAAVGTLETQMNIDSGIPGLNPRYSTEALFSCGGGGCDSGWYPSSAANYLKKTGVPDEACAPYTMGATGKDVSCSAKCANAASRSQKIIGFATPRGAQAVKEALKKGPMMTTMTVYADFITYSSGVYKHTTGGTLGGHAVSLVGFDDAKRAWIIRNSWGTDWGMGGFAYMSYEDRSGIADDNQLFQLAPQKDYLWTEMRDRAFVSGTTDIQIHSSSKEPKNISVTIISESNKLVKMSQCMGSECIVNVNTENMADGKYELAASQGDFTMYRYFYVSNRAQNFNLSARPQKFDPNKPVKDRIEFDISLSSDGRIPLKRIALVYMNESGAIKERWTESVADQMSIGWRTPMVPNGRYKVWIKGESYAQDKLNYVESTKFDLNIQN